MGLGPKWHPKKELIDKKLETDNERDLFIVGQTIIERKVDEIMVERFHIPEEALNDPRFSMNLEILILTESDWIEKPLKTNLKKINQIRNLYAHRVDPDDNTVEQHIDGLEYFSRSDHMDSVPEGEIHKFDKYRICVKQTFDELEKLLEK